MKIYPSSHKIKPVYNERIDSDLNVPLAYINTETTRYNISKTISIEYDKDSMMELLPNQEFDSLDVKIFNLFKEEVDVSKLLTREGNKYIYRPKKSITFSPQTFLYKTIIKKSLNYSTSKSYNINALCVDDPDSLDLTQRLSQVLINPSDRSLLPSNISINKNIQNISAVTTGSIKECDFVFIESPDGVHYDESETPIKINYDEFLNNNTNVFVSIEGTDTYEMLDQGVEREFTLKDSIILNNKKCNARIVFDLERIIDKPGIVVHNLFTTPHAPILIEERLGKGYVIYASSEILRNPNKYASLIYEVMSYVYFNSYDSSDYIREWITDDIPDYQVDGKRLKKKSNFSSTMSLYNCFKLKASEMQLYNVDIINDPNNTRYYTNNNDNVIVSTESNINFVGEQSGHLFFKKNKTTSTYNLKDPEKPLGWVSIYNQGEIIYVDNIYYLIEESLSDKVFAKEEGDNLKVTIAPFKKSLKNINHQSPMNITINFFKTENDNIIKIRSNNYFFYVKNHKIEYCDEYDWNEELGELMFNIKIEQVNDYTTVFDMRQLGGGLPEDLTDNYDLLDIGHINGRPYRKTGTVIITLPTIYQEYEKEILDAVKKYMSAEEYPIIIFENKEE